MVFLEPLGDEPQCATQPELSWVAWRAQGAAGHQRAVAKSRPDA